MYEVVSIASCGVRQRKLPASPRKEDRKSGGIRINAYTVRVMWMTVYHQEPMQLTRRIKHCIAQLLHLRHAYRVNHPRVCLHEPIFEFRSQSIIVNVAAP